MKSASIHTVSIQLFHQKQSIDFDPITKCRSCELATNNKQQHKYGAVTTKTICPLLRLSTKTTNPNPEQLANTNNT